MPKLKTNRSARKRFKKTGTGKIMRHKSHKRHILTKKTTKRKRQSRKALPVNKTEMGRVERMIPY